VNRGAFSLALAGTIHPILSLDVPFSGLMLICAASLRNALVVLGS
jgi:hypothetical protein